MNRIIVERRLEMLDMAFSGVRLTDFVPTLAEKYGVSESAIWNDWSRRARWLPQLVQMDESALKLSELIGRLERALTRAYALMLTTTNEPVRVGATRTVGSLSKTLFEIGSAAGMYPSIMRDILAKLEKLEEEMKT